MARAADPGSAGGSPFAKFTDLDDTLVGAFGSAPRECIRQMRNYETGKPAVKDDNSPRKEEIMWFISMPGTTAKTGNADDGYEPIEEGAEVCFSVSGFRWGQVIEQRKQLPAHAGFRAGQPCSGDVYTIRLAGWSAATKNPAAAAKAGFTLVGGRIVLGSQEAKDTYVLAQSRSGNNTNPAKDYQIEIRRPGPADKRWEQAADELFDRKPWAAAAATAAAPVEDDSEPF